MKRTIIIAILIAALTLTTAAVAGSAGYWARGGNTYICKGTETGVICNETNWKPRYEVAILKNSIVVAYRKQVIFGCDRGYSPADNCSYYGP